MKKSTRVNLLFAAVYCVILLAAIYWGQQYVSQKESLDIPFEDSLQRKDEKANDIVQIIKHKYVDDINTDSLQFLPIDSMLHQLDPHSNYMGPSEVNEMLAKLDGNFEGIGVEYYILNDTLLVTRVVKDGPAAHAGLKTGDKILRIDTLNVSGRNLPRQAVMGRMRGPRGTSVQLLVARPNTNSPFTLQIKRNRVDVSSIDAGYMLNAETAYIKIGQFGSETTRDFIAVCRNLKEKGMKSLVLDLRNNGGGYLNAAISLANQFLPEKQLIVYTEGKHEGRKNYYSSGGGEFEQGKLVVLINENSASASEIFAGAIQDNKRGIIVGRRSFGKGLVQEQFALEDGSAINLTIARYYTPSGRSIQKPYNRGLKAYQNEIEDRLNTGELTAEADKIDSFYNSLPSINKEGRKVFSGGGIQPNIYVKLDTIGLNHFYQGLIKKNILIDFVLEVLAERYNAAYLTSTINSFSISDKDYIAFLKYLQWRKIPLDNKQLIRSKPLIYQNLKLLLYKYYLGEQGFYRVQNKNDNMVKEAIQSLNDVNPK